MNTITKIVTIGIVNAIGDWYIINYLTTTQNLEFIPAIFVSNMILAILSYWVATRNHFKQ